MGSGKKNDRSLWIVVVLGFSLLPLLFGLVSFVSSGFDLLSSIEQEGIILSLGIVALGFVIFFFGVFYVISTFYFFKRHRKFNTFTFKGLTNYCC